jgi:hypothetical protein
MSASSATSLGDFVSKSVIDSLEENARIKAENERLKIKHFLAQAYISKNRRPRFNDDEAMALKATFGKICVDVCDRCLEFFVSFVLPEKRHLYINGKFCQCFNCKTFKLYTYGFCERCIAKYGDRRLSCEPDKALRNDFEERKLRDINQPSPETVAKRTAEWLNGNSYCKADE